MSPRLARLLAALLLVTLVVRAPITAVPPVLSSIAQELALTPVAAGLVTTLPLLCFGVFAFLTPLLTAWVGRERTLGLALAVVVVGLVVRLFVSVPSFFAGTLLIGLGIAVGNVVIPAIVRSRFAARLALVMGLYTVMIQVSGTGGAFLTVPLVKGAGWPWPWAIGLWLAPAALALVVWTIAATRIAHDEPLRDAGPRAVGTTPLGVVARRLLPWGVVGVMGLQSLVYYSVLTWLPAQLVRQGFSVAAAGALLGTFNVAGVPGSFLGARLLASPRRGQWVALLAAAGVAGLALIGTAAAPIPGVLLLGACQGFNLAVALTTIAHQHDPADVPATSALGQGFGYLLAACGPVTVGALYAATGSFAVPDAVLASILAVWGALTIAVVRAEARKDAPGH